MKHQNQMNTQSIKQVLETMRLARDTIQYQFNPTHPHTEFPSVAISDMYYQLNDYCIMLSVLYENTPPWND